MEPGLFPGCWKFLKIRPPRLFFILCSRLPRSFLSLLYSLDFRWLHELQVTSHLINDLRRDFALRSCVGDQQGIVADHVDEPGDALGIQSYFLNRPKVKQLFALVTDG